MGKKDDTRIDVTAAILTDAEWTRTCNSVRESAKKSLRVEYARRARIREQAKAALAKGIRLVHLESNPQPEPLKAKVGMRFEHGRFQNIDGSPAAFRVTAIRKGVIFYRGLDGSGSYFAEPDYFWRVVFGRPLDHRNA